jgi:8-oxo-dGTP pyrophosphatase MutT (NUDIX family)
MTTYHPKLNDQGDKVALHRPSTPTALSSWMDPRDVATVVPEGPMPPALNGIPIAAGQPSADQAAWKEAADLGDLEEPDFKPAPGKKPAAGVVIIELDGRVWLVAPSNGFGGYTATFPKGRLEPGIGPRATALKEAFEETGLRVRLSGFLIDVPRGTTYTRYYLAERIGGSPSEMGWESQAVHLVPREMLSQFLTNAFDAPLLRVLQDLPVTPLTRSQITRSAPLTSGHRVIATVNGFRRRFGRWPTQLLVQQGMVEALPRDVLTAQAWAMLCDRLDVIPISDGTIFAVGCNGERFEYDAVHDYPNLTPGADLWIWGCRVK